MTPRHPTMSAALLAALGMATFGPVQAQGAAPPLLTVSVVAARQGCVADRITGTGFIGPIRQADVRATREGSTVGEIIVEAGDTVAADQVLARLTPTAGSDPGDTAVRSPIRGTVVAIAATRGARAAPDDAEPLFRIVGAEGFVLRAVVLASQLARLKPDLPATVHVLGLGDLPGTVTAIGGTLDPATQTGEVTIALGDPRLRAGAFGRAEIEAGQDCGLLVPVSALLAGREGLVAAVVRRDRIEMRRVTAGSIAGGRVILLDGVDADDQVVARAAAFLREGDRVRAVPLGETEGASER